MNETAAPPPKEAQIDQKDYREAFGMIGLNAVINKGREFHNETDKPKTISKGRAYLEWVGFAAQVKDTKDQTIEINSKDDKEEDIPRVILTKAPDGSVTSVDAAMLFDAQGKPNPDLVDSVYSIKNVKTVEGKIMYTVTKKDPADKDKTIEETVAIAPEQVVRAVLFAGRRSIAAEMKPETDPIAVAYLQSLDKGAEAVMADKKLQSAVEKESAERYISGTAAYRFIDVQIEDVEEQLKKLSEKKEEETVEPKPEGEDAEGKDEKTEKIDPDKDREKARLEDLQQRLTELRNRFKTESGDLKLVANPADLAEAMVVMSEQDMSLLKEQLKMLDGKVPAAQLEAITKLVENPKEHFETFFKAVQSGAQPELAKAVEACLGTGNTNQIKEQVLKYMKTQMEDEKEAEEIVKKFWETAGGKSVLTVLIIALGLTIPALTAAMTARR